MLLTEVNFHSELLGVHCALYVLLPQRTLAEMQTRRKPKYRTLYLLHGHSDDHTAWLRWTAIEKHAEGLNMAIVMPAANLSFYTDMVHGKPYQQFISEEVPAIVRDMFPLSDRREDNFVAGLSMGGYGAFKLALTYPERYAAAASLSGAVDIREVVNRQRQQMQILSQNRSRSLNDRRTRNRKDHCGAGCACDHRKDVGVGRAGRQPNGKCQRRREPPFQARHP